MIELLPRYFQNRRRPWPSLGMWRRLPIVERRYLIDNLRRSITMLTSGAPALNREEAMRLVVDLEDTERRLAGLIGELRRLADDAESR